METSVLSPHSPVTFNESIPKPNEIQIENDDNGITQLVSNLGES